MTAAQSTTSVGPSASWSAGQITMACASSAAVVGLVVGVSVWQVVRRRHELDQQKRWEENYWRGESELNRRLERPGVEGWTPSASLFANLNVQNITSCYRLFGCSSDTPMARVTKRYRDLVKRYHPDTCAQSGEDAAEQERRMELINQAYGAIRSSRVDSIHLRRYNKPINDWEGQE